MAETALQTRLDASLGDVEPQAPPKPHITGTGIGLAAIGWTLYALLYTFFLAQENPEVPFVFLLFGQAVYSLILALYSVPAWWVTVREMDSMHWGWVLGAHLLIAPLYSWGGLESYLAVIQWIAGSGANADVEANYEWVLYGTLFIYIIQFALYHLVRNVQRLRQKEQQATELLAIAREQQLAALKAQVNPHFLFNTLNSISATLKRDPDQAREMIAQLAGLMRYALDSADRDRVPLREEVNFVQRYLDLERHRFSDRLDARVDVEADDDALDTTLPPMVLQPLVENALRHGISPSEEGGQVTVRIAENDDRLQVRVEDTGVGTADATQALSEAPDGTGLRNTSTRLEHTYGPDAALRTAPNEPTGFAVWFSIPKNGAAPTQTP